MRPTFTIRTLIAVLGLGAMGALAASCVEQDEDKPSDEDMKYVKQHVLQTAPSPRFSANADLDGKVVYLGMDSEGLSVEPGKDIKLTHYWKVVTPPGEGWRTFTHLEGPNRQGFVNADHVPVRGKYAVSQWKAGEIIRDEHSVRLPPSWTQPQVTVLVGMWRGPTRMPVKAGPHDAEGRIVAGTLPVRAAPKPEAARKRYVARQVTKGPKIDGKLDDAVWAEAPSTGVFVNTLTGAPAEQKTEAKLLWDNKFLYVAFDNEDSDIWANLTKRDDKLWTQEADELLIDADGNGKTYIELQVAPNGAIFDSYLPEYRKYEDSVDPKKKPYSWSSKVNAKVQVDGTLNKRGDEDKRWTVEMAIPLEDVKGMSTEGPKLPPSIGDVWRVNMFRMDAPENKPQRAWGWAPPLVGDFHALQRFGEVVFGDEKGEIRPPVIAGAGEPAKTEPAKGRAKEGAAATAAADKEGAKKPAAAKPGAAEKQPAAAEKSGAAAKK